MSIFPHAHVAVTADPRDAAPVADLSAYRARRNAADTAQAAGLALHEELYAEATDFVMALVAGGAP